MENHCFTNDSLLRGNNCNCSGLQLKVTFAWLNARQRNTIEYLNHIKRSSPSTNKINPEEKIN